MQLAKKTEGSKNVNKKKVKQCKDGVYICTPACIPYLLFAS